jgi:hypothetical protein
VDKRRRPELTIRRILELADPYHARTGDWPTPRSGPVDEDRELTWRRIDSALRLGLRGLPGGDSLAQLLARERGVRNVRALPELTEELILSWADWHRERTENWPTEESGPIEGALGEVLKNVNAALMLGLRGLPGGSSLHGLLRARRHLPGKHSPRSTPDADAPGTWPNAAGRRVCVPPGSLWPRSARG